VIRPGQRAARPERRRLPPEKMPARAARAAEDDPLTISPRHVREGLTDLKAIR